MNACESTCTHAYVEHVNSKALCPLDSTTTLHLTTKTELNNALMIKVGVWRGKLNHVLTPMLSERCEPIEHRTKVSPARCRKLVYRLYSAPDPQRFSPMAGKRRQFGHNLNPSFLRFLAKPQTSTWLLEQSMPHCDGCACALLRRLRLPRIGGSTHYYFSC
jgi:hypothetical protein